MIIHYRSRGEQAQALEDELNSERDHSARALQADLAIPEAIQPLALKAVAEWGRLDGLVNNASVFYPTPIQQATQEDWNTVMSANLQSPFFLAQACLSELRKNSGVIVNIIDIYSQKPLANHPLYCASKAGLASLTLSLAKDLAPDIRVNGVSPGAILWPEGDATMDQAQQQSILNKTPLGRTGKPADIAGAVAYLMSDAPFVTGQILSVDGGRSLNM